MDNIYSKLNSVNDNNNKCNNNSEYNTNSGPALW